MAKNTAKQCCEVNGVDKKKLKRTFAAAARDVPHTRRVPGTNLMRHLLINQCAN